SCMRLVRKPAGGLAPNDQGASTATGDEAHSFLGCGVAAGSTGSLDGKPMQALEHSEPDRGMHAQGERGLGRGHHLTQQGERVGHTVELFKDRARLGVGSTRGATFRISALTRLKSHWNLILAAVNGKQVCAKMWLGCFS